MVSDLADITCGIPQGSTVSPLMYIIYVNDILTSIKNCKYYMYADDTVIYTTGSLLECTQRLTTDLSMFKHWCNKNKLTLNIKKTKYTIFGLRSKTRHLGNHTLRIDDTKLIEYPLINISELRWMQILLTINILKMLLNQYLIKRCCWQK